MNRRASPGVKAALAFVAVLVISPGGCDGGDNGGDGGSGDSARAHALRACEAAEKFEAAVKRNDDIDTVNRHLNKARREAGAAEKKDSLYVGLASGIEALRIAIDNDDASAAKVGMSVVRTECRYVKQGDAGADAPADSNGGTGGGTGGTGDPGDPGGATSTPADQDGS